MGYLDNAAADWEFVDGVETVSLTDESASATDSSVKAYRRAGSRPGAGGLGVHQETVVFEAWAATSTIAPEEGDTIVDSTSVTWKVLAVETVSIGNTVLRYVCRCVKHR